jgi:hypothetical protein
MNETGSNKWMSESWKLSLERVVRSNLAGKRKWLEFWLGEGWIRGVLEEDEHGSKGQVD